MKVITRSCEQPLIIKTLQNCTPRTPPTSSPSPTVDFFLNKYTQIIFKRKIKLQRKGQVTFFVVFSKATVCEFTSLLYGQSVHETAYYEQMITVACLHQRGKVNIRNIITKLAFCKLDTSVEQVTLMGTSLVPRSLRS